MIDTTDYYNPLTNYFQIQQNSRGLMQIVPIPGWVLYNPTFESCIIETKFQKRPIKKSDQKTLKIARAHGLPKVHKSFDRVPSFQPTIDTIGSTHCNVGKYIMKLLNRLTQNKY